MEDDLFAEVLVVLLFPAGDRHAAELHAGCGRLDRDLVAIEVVVVGDVPAQSHAVARGALRREHEGLVGGQEIRVGLGAAAEQRTQVEAAAFRGRSTSDGNRRSAGDAHGPRHRHCPGLRRVAEARIGAALQFHLDVEIPGCAAEGDRYANLRIVAIDDLLAEELVLVVEADGQARRAERDSRRRRFEAEPVAVEVIAGSDVEADDEFIRRWPTSPPCTPSARGGSRRRPPGPDCDGKEWQQQHQQAQAPADWQGGDQWHERVSPSGGVGASANDTWTGPVGRCSRPIRESAQESIAIVWPGRRTATATALQVHI